MYRQTILKIDLAAIAHNYKQIQKTIGSKAHIMAIIKANAYGHGDVQVGKKLYQLGCRHFGVATIEEGVHLRKNGLKGSIYILSGCGKEHVHVIVKNRLTPVLSSLELAWHFQTHLKKRIPVHIKIDTGMGRLGLHHDKCLKAFVEMKKMKKLQVQGVMSHCGQSEKLRSRRTLDQVSIFKNLVPKIKAILPKISFFHIANSAAVLHKLGVNYNMVRIGIALYGEYPDKNERHVHDVHLKSALKLETSILALKKFKKSSFISYGETFKTKRESRIAVIPLGYADGWKRCLSNKGYVLVHGRRAPMVGTICMDLIMIDVTDIAGVRVGDPVVCIGEQGSEKITAALVALWAKTINYEILTSFTPRIPKSYT